MADAHANFAYSTITGTVHVGDNNAAGTAGTSIAIQYGDSAGFPPPPFNATVWPAGTQPLETGNSATTAEIVRVTAVSDDTLTISRQQEGSENRSIAVGDQIAATVTAKTLTDAEAPLTYWVPVHVAGAGQTGLQTLGNTAQAGTNSLFVFPVTVPPNLQFNQILIGNSLSEVTQSVSGSFIHSSFFGIYSMNQNTVLSLISSNSSSIIEYHSSRSMSSFNYATATATSGYASGTLPGGAVTGTQQQSSYISGTRIVGMQFGGNMTLTGGVYYIGLLSIHTTSNSRSTFGLSQAGIIGQPINPVNAVSASIMPIGSASSAWQANNANLTNWWNRQVIGFLTNTVRAGFGGSQIPNAVTLSELGTTGGVGSTATILPTVTFVST